MKPKQLYRFSKQEIILRFLAFSDRQAQYEGHLAKFLNHYMHDNQNAPDEFLAEKRSLFRETVDCIFEKIFSKSAPPKISLTVLEALLIGVGRNLASLRRASPEQVKHLYEQLLSNEDFSELSLKEGLSKRHRVNNRLDAATEIFSRVA